MNKKAELLNELRIDHDALERAPGGAGRWLGLALVAIAITALAVWWALDRRCWSRWR